MVVVGISLTTVEPSDGATTSFYIFIKHFLYIIYNIRSSTELGFLNVSVHVFEMLHFENTSSEMWGMPTFDSLLPPCSDQ